MRFGPATLLFLPVYLRHGLLPGGARPRDALLIAGLGGFAFILFLSSGLRFAPVADAGVFTPSMLPIYVAILSVVVLGERFRRSQITGFALIVLGALAVGGWEAIHGGAPGAWRGHLLFSAASMAWASYTVAFRASGLSALHAAALLCFWSFAGMLALAALFGTRFDAVPVPTLALQFFLQGVLSGFLATFTYGFAIGRLGAARTASFAALVPILAALGGWAMLGESIPWSKGIGIVVVATGVALASRRP